VPISATMEDLTLRNACANHNEQLVLRVKSQRYMANDLPQSQSTKSRKHTEQRGRTPDPQRNGTLGATSLRGFGG
jgi:hypothetical protein